MTTFIQGLYGLDSASAWRTLQKDPQKYIDRFAKDKTVQKNISDFNSKAVKFTSVDELLKDKKSLQYLLDSYGLGSEINNIGRLKKVLTEDPTKTDSLVNKLADTRFKTMASALRMDQGMSKLNSRIFRDNLETSYIQNEFEEALGEQDPALRQAAYFARNSTGISNVYSVLGDKILRNVVTSTFNLPQELAIQSIETQAKVVAAKIDFSKFAAADSTGKGSVTAAQLARAKSDHKLIQTNLAVSDAALKQVKSIQTQIAQIATDYANLSTVTNPTGANAATIALQKQAVPTLIGNDQALQAANTSVDSITKSLATLSGLIDKAKKPDSDLAALKSQFSSIVATINEKINNAEVTNPDGTTQNILLNGAADIVTTAYETNGASVNIHRYDVSGLQSLLNSADTAFNAASSNTDNANLLAAQSRLLRTQDGVNAVNKQLDADRTAFDATMNASPFFAASLNSSALTKGKQSVDDALSRVGQIEDLLAKIGQVAVKAKGLPDGADRTELSSQFANYQTQLRSLVDNTGKAGLDNFLNSNAAYSYEVIDGKTISTGAGRDLSASIADVLATQSIDTKADASALEIKALQLTSQTDGLKASITPSKAILDRVVSTYDPKSKLDSQLYALQSKVDSLVSGAAKGGVNLLSPDQKKVQLAGLSTGKSLSFTPQTAFKADLTSALNNIVGQLGNNTNAILDALDDTATFLNRTTNALTSDNRSATLEYGKLGATIDVLDPDNTTTTSSKYQTNSFTAKFISRYLGVAGSDGSTASTSYLSNLFTDSSDSSSAVANIFSLVGSIKA